MPRASHRLRMVFGLATCIFASAALAADGTAQPVPDTVMMADADSVDTASRRPAPDAGAADDAQFIELPERGPWWTLWSWRTSHDRMIVGMFTSHLDQMHHQPDNNYALGVVLHGFFGATFITTYGHRGWVAGFERAWVEGTLGPFKTMFGFRAGLVYGYDGRLFKPAEWTPILPYAQPVLLARAGPVSLDFAYTWAVVSLSAGLTVW